jgi:hypothetical protein
MADAPQERVGAGYESKFLGESRSCPSSEGETDERKRLLQAVGLAVVSGQSRQPFGEDVPLAPEVVAEKRRTPT